MSVEIETVETETGTEKSVRRKTGAKLRRIAGAGSLRKRGDSTTRESGKSR